MAIIKRFDTSVKPAFQVTLAMSGGLTDVPTILDTGAIKPPRLGTKRELESTGAILISCNGTFKTASGAVIKDCLIYRTNVLLHCDINDVGFNLRNVDITVSNAELFTREDYKLLIPYSLLNGFNIHLYSYNCYESYNVNFKYRELLKHGHIAINTRSNVVNYNVRSVNGTPVEVRELTKDDTVLDID